METEKTKRDFAVELRDMAVKCIGCKPNTVKKKANKILKKYDELINYSVSDRDYYIKEYDKMRQMYNALKTGVVSYTNGKIYGKLLIKDIEQVELKENDVILKMKNGRQIIMGSDFAYLYEMF